MSEISFDEEKTYAPMGAPPERAPKGLYKLAIQLGLAKDEAGARMILIVAIIIFLGLAIAYPFIFG